GVSPRAGGPYRKPLPVGARSRMKDPIMTSLVLFCCLAWTQEGIQPPTSSPPSGAAPVDVVAALETAMADAIAKAEPSVVAIHREKAQNTRETQAVRGRKREHHFPEPTQVDFRLPRTVDPDDF